MCWSRVRCAILQCLNYQAPEVCMPWAYNYNRFAASRHELRRLGPLTSSKEAADFIVTASKGTVLKIHADRSLNLKPQAIDPGSECPTLGMLELARTSLKSRLPGSCCTQVSSAWQTSTQRTAPKKVLLCRLDGCSCRPASTTL